MVRNYRDEPVPREQIDRIVAAGLRGPSAGFTQGVYFVVVTQAETRRRVAEICGEEEYAARGFDRWMSGAPVHIAVCVSEADYHARYNESDKLQEDRSEVAWPVPYWWVDAGAALMLLLLAAVDEGLSAGFFGTHRAQGLGEVLMLPQGVTAVGVVTIGHAAPDRRSGSLARGRRSIAELVRWERWE